MKMKRIAMALAFAGVGLMAAPTSAAAVGGTGGGGGGVPTGGGGGGIPIGGPGVTCWSADGFWDNGASACPSGQGPCVVPGQIPLDNITRLSYAQEGVMSPWGPSGGWSCGPPGAVTPPIPSFVWPNFAVTDAKSTAPGQVTDSSGSPRFLVFDTQTASLNPCLLGAAPPGIPGLSSAPLIAPAMPASGFTPLVVPKQPAPCPSSVAISGQDANYSYHLYEINVLVPGAPCLSAGAPYTFNWIEAGVTTAAACGLLNRTSTHKFTHVGNVSTSATAHWMTYCMGDVLDKAGGPGAAWPWSSLTINPSGTGYTMFCDGGHAQIFNPTPVKQVVQIESVPNG